MLPRGHGAIPPKEYNPLTGFNEKYRKTEGRMAVPQTVDSEE